MNYDFDLDNIFTYHSPTPEQLKKYQAIREAAKVFANIVLKNTPKCADQTTAIRNIREAVMIANASVALEGQLYK